jgi:DNA-binding response OmpR family regulator
VLIIDDNEDITDMISMYLETKGIACKVANRGRDGLQLIRNEQFDTILMDVAMPEFSGYDILDHLRRDGLVNSKNIIIYTASSMSDGEKEKLRAMGARSFLKKPTSIDDILAAVDPRP